MWNNNNNHISNGLPSTSKASNSANLQNGTGAVPDSTESERRRTAYHYQNKIKDEMRKAQQGICSEENISRLFEQVKGQDGLEHIESLRTMKADGQTLEHLTQLSITELDRMRNETAKTLDPDLFLARLKVFTNRNVKENEDVFDALGRRYTQLMRCIPDFYYLRPCFEISKEPEVRVAAARKYCKRVKLEVQEVRAKTMREMQEEEKVTTSVSKELDNIKHYLRAYFKAQASDEVDYYRFVLNPDNRRGFAETIENMFFVSFLVKDGAIRLRIDELGLPHIVKISREERSQHKQRGEMETQQVIGHLDHHTWRALVQKLGIEKAYIKRQQPNGGAAVAE